MAPGGTHWNGAYVAETYSIGMLYDALAPIVAACSYVDGIERFPNVSAPALSFITVDSTASRKRHGGDL